MIMHSFFVRREKVFSCFIFPLCDSYQKNCIKVQTSVEFLTILLESLEKVSNESWSGKVKRES